MFDEYYLLFRYEITNLRHQYYLKRLVSWAEIELDANPLLSMEMKEKIKKT
ncbi:hypothetical protein [Methanococcoides alaskense]|uniref:Uncharacterized protein n=1 Tax=Methanococcoides alaskense TaxID=325778 RepID=A0AA90TXN1_9EURY|nr:hypothetical protein [Methanococcoides alaskense]MDA0525170.1 hypothetical protein [Methanococcoides alaskense]MDR6221909.1 hypothetical protein [Methanococcoides alaskense]